jgi:hypothetical protein
MTNTPYYVPILNKRRATMSDVTVELFKLANEDHKTYSKIYNCLKKFQGYAKKERYGYLVEQLEFIRLYDAVELADVSTEEWADMRCDHSMHGFLEMADGYTKDEINEDFPEDITQDEFDECLGYVDEAKLYKVIEKFIMEIGFESLVYDLYLTGYKNKTLQCISDTTIGDLIEILLIGE